MDLLHKPFEVRFNQGTDIFRQQTLAVLNQPNQDFTGERLCGHHAGLFRKHDGEKGDDHADQNAFQETEQGSAKTVEFAHSDEANNPGHDAVQEHHGNRSTDKGDGQCQHLVPRRLCVEVRLYDRLQERPKPDGGPKTDNHRRNRCQLRDHTFHRTAQRQPPDENQNHDVIRLKIAHAFVPKRLWIHAEDTYNVSHSEYHGCNET